MTTAAWYDCVQSSVQPVFCLQRRRARVNVVATGRWTQFARQAASPGGAEKTEAGKTQQNSGDPTGRALRYL